ncbi:hypothetical protein [Methylocystis sp.]|uniref:hypothetical protein n=1 Tax=Methylocystis sp. TaxID=1911079 RepID=UPI003DA5747E
MINFDAGAILYAHSGIRSLIEIVTDPNGNGVQGGLCQQDKDNTLGYVIELEESLRNLNVPITKMAVDELVKKLNDPSSNLTFISARDGLIDISVTFRRELSRLKSFCVKQDKESFYDIELDSFAPGISSKFPQAGYEIDEAGKCLALGRATASVFHLMRMMEIAIRSVSKCLGIPDPIKDCDRNWGKMLEKIKSSHDLKSKHGWSCAADKELFSGIYVSLDAVRVAWRNATMHVESKYTDDEAEHIFVAVRGLMRKIVARIDEDGLPLA